MESCRPITLPVEDRKLPSLVVWVVPISAGEARANTLVCSNTHCMGVEGVYSRVTTL
jgi:hypothetical protein